MCRVKVESFASPDVGLVLICFSRGDSPHHKLSFLELRSGIGERQHLQVFYHAQNFSQSLAKR